MKWTRVAAITAVAAVLVAGVVPPARASTDVASLAITPGEQVLRAGDTQTFVVTAYSSAGEDLGPVPALIEYWVRPDNPPLANEGPPLGAAGTCDGLTCGPYYGRGTVIIYASYEGASATATLRVEPGPVDHVRMWVPDGPFVAGSAIWLPARLEDRYGNAIAHPEPVVLDLAAKAGGGGSTAGVSCDDAAQTCRATDDGGYLAIATFERFNLRTVADIEIVAGRPRLAITPSTARIQPRPFPDRFTTVTATVADEFGNAVPASAWVWLQDPSGSSYSDFPSDPTLNNRGGQTDERGRITWVVEAGHHWGSYVFKVEATPDLEGEFVINVAPLPREVTVTVPLP